jgi:hypothetical protein
LLTKTTKKRSTNPKKWLRFTHPLKSMYNDVDTYAVRDREWKNKMIALSNMPLMTIKEL